MKVKLLIPLLILTGTLRAQTANWETLPWAPDVKAMLSQFLTCGGPTPPATPCNVFTAQTLEKIYHITDFDLAGGNYMRANDIAAFVENGDKWTLLGDAGDQNVLNQAQGYANLGKAVIAVEYANAGSGHVCIIIPGNLTPSGQWKLSCPNSASFFINKPSKAYVGMSLSYAFPTPAGVKIYGRNFQP